MARAALAAVAALLWATIATGVEWLLASWAPAGTWTVIALVNLGLAAALAISLAWFTRRRPLRAFGIALGVAVATSLALVPANVRAPGPVLWIVCDTLRADRMSLYGYERPTSPFFEAWAEELLVFDRAYSQAAHTLVSAPSILASLYPSTHGLVDYDDVLDSNAALVSETLRAAGFTTFGASSNPHVGRINGFDQGWDKFESPEDWEPQSSADVNRRFFDWRESHRDGAPYFALLWYIDPHTPFQWDAAAADWAGLDPGQSFRHRPEPKDASASQSVRMHARWHYDAAVRSVDNSLAQLVEFLKTRGDYDDALLLFTSDHGESLWEHGRFGHNYGLYESLTHVPLAIRLPSPLRFPQTPAPGGRIGTIASSVDLLPTTLAFLGIAADASHQGRSLLPDIEGGGPGAAYLEQRLDRYGPYRIYGIREDDHKYIWVEKLEDADVPYALLFDVAADPAEQRNLAESKPELAARLHERIVERRSRYEAVALEPGKAAHDARLRRLLEQLGYVDADAQPESP